MALARSLLGVVIAPAFTIAALAGCGSDSGSDQRAEQEQSRQVRADARRQAQQEKRIRELERRVREREKPGTSGQPAPSTSSSPETPATGPSSSEVTLRGYWERCGDASGATQVMHHDEDCPTAQRVARAYSRDNPDPEGWSCSSRGRGRTAVVHSSREVVVTCAKKPGNAVRVIRFKLSA